eukprot:12398905-Karenia_brevis.AAC.1
MRCGTFSRHWPQIQSQMQLWTLLMTGAQITDCCSSTPTKKSHVVEEWLANDFKSDQWEVLLDTEGKTLKILPS